MATCLTFKKKTVNTQQQCKARLGLNAVSLVNSLLEKYVFKISNIFIQAPNKQYFTICTEEKEEEFSAEFEELSFFSLL